MSSPRRSPLLIVLLLLLVTSGGTRAAAAQSGDAGTLPAGFVKETAAKGLDGPTAFAIAADGRIYIAQKAGTVRVVQNGKLLRENFVDLSGEVNQAYNRGLMGIALHPNFPQTPYVYLAYVYQPPEAAKHKETGRAWHGWCG